MSVELNMRYYQTYNYEEEEWRSIVGYRKYEISNYSRVRNLDGKILKPSRVDRKTMSSYYTTTIRNDVGTPRKFAINDLMKMAKHINKHSISISVDGCLVYKKSSEYIFDAY